MSDRMKALMWEYPAETAAEKLILLKMGDISNDRGQSIYFSMGVYAKAAVITKRGARKIIARLKEWKIILLDRDLAVQLALKGKTVNGEVYRLNVVRIREYILAEEIMSGLFADDPEAELSSASDEADGADEAELSSASDGVGGAELSSGEAELSSGIYPYKESIQTTPYSPPEPDFAEDFEKLWAEWTPFEMTKGDEPQAKKKYTEARKEGVTAEQVALAARVYCQQCKVTRCKTKHMENWLRSCVWHLPQKGLGEGNGKSRDKKLAAAEAAKPRALRHQLWHDAIKQQWGEAVYRSWIERLWLEGDIVYCPSKFAADFVQERYGRSIAEAIGHAVRYAAEPPPEWAYADYQSPTGENENAQDQVTA